MQEHWNQLTIETDESPDQRVLIEVASLVDALRERLVAWHFFWEPDLWVRLRWRSIDARQEGLRAIADRLTALNARVGPYEWQDDARMVGHELWERCQRDWMNGAELAVALLRAQRDGRATKTASFHWTRHVHLFSNQLVGTWAREAQLSLEQARYRIWLLSRTAGNEADRPALEATVASLDAMLADTKRLSDCERRFVRSWRADGRPPIEERLDLPADFARQRRERGTARED